jgi:hypothetical protein
MANVHISDLPAGAALNGSERFEAEQPANTTSVYLTANQLLAFNQSQGQALTRVNDTNVTATLGGTPGTALLAATSITLGWSGTLSGTRGGTGVNNGGNTITLGGNVNTANSFTTSGNFAMTLTAGAISNATLPAGTHTLAALDLADQTVSGGANVTSDNLGTPGNGSTVTIDCGACPLQYLTNNVAGFTIAAPANDGSCMLLITNGASAGTITFSGFSVGSNTGDALTTTNTQKFTVSIWRVNGTSGYRIAAHQ